MIGDYRDSKQMAGLFGRIEVLILDDGSEFEVLDRPAQGARHTVLRGRELGSGDSVVIKIELVPDALAIERLALEWVSAHDGPAPTVRKASTVSSPDGRRARCLVMDDVEGRAPDSNAGWRRMGRTLAALTGLPWTGAGLPIYDHDTFGDAHQKRLRDLGTAIPASMRGIAGWEQLSFAHPPALGPLVIAHGDPGPGNFLDNGHGGTLIDWEEAQIAPRGLDLARAMFIALLGSGPAGFTARDQHARAQSVASGYLKRLEHTWLPGVAELRWWLTAAGIQFAHRRLKRAGQPGVLSWTDAITVLAHALTHDRAWISESLLAGP